MHRAIGTGRRPLRSGCLRFYSRHALIGGAYQSSTARRGHASPKLNLRYLDQKWQYIWEMKRPSKELKSSNGKKMYILPMFPYPSGELHLGHLRVYTISDVLSRFKTMQGYNVMHPIGWDAFGLPAENAAIDRGIDPAEWTQLNIKLMKEQLRAMNGSWDWDREFATCDPKFYKHTQQLFLLLHSHGLAYQAESLVNYDPVDKTVLANEQVDSNGRSWRSGAKVEQRRLKQWFLRISRFRQALLDDLEFLSKDGRWPERVLAMQKHWLGKSEGARIKFQVVGNDEGAHSPIEAFTTRPDTIFGVQYIALAATHPIVKELASTDMELQTFLNTMPTLPADTKVGYLLPNVRAINPLAYEETTPDATKAPLPIFVAPYVLGDYGDGAVMGVPGHDARDHAFWRHNSNGIPVRQVIVPTLDEPGNPMTNGPFLDHGFLNTHNGQYSGQSTAEATKNIINLLQSGEHGVAADTWRLRDWLISRQRYWGTPIPIIHCNTCGPVSVPENELPVELPNVSGFWALGKAGNPLENAHEWVNTSCPKCGGAAKRDTDTMDTFVDSSWYFMRFPDPENESMPFSAEKADAALPVDLYIGGVEHAILHLLYARFISKFLATTSLWPSGSDPATRGEPFKQVLTQGMVHGKTYTDPSNGRFLKPGEVRLRSGNPFVVATGEKANVTYEKMSKSKYNGVDPRLCMSEYGADATRAHILFQAPVSEVLEWNEEKISGVTRWLNRLYGHINQQSKTWRAADPDGKFCPTSHVGIAMTTELSMRAQQDFKGNNGPSDNSLSQETIRRIKAEAETTSLLDEAVKLTFEADMDLWRTVQETIQSVTESYGNTYSLNTVVSDLMALTNAIMDNAGMELGNGKMRGLVPNPSLNKHATMALVQMMAPITPAFAEECWAMLNPGPPSFWETILPPFAASTVDKLLQPNDKPSIESVFAYPFPTPDDTLEKLNELARLRTQPCAVQVNGKLKFAVDIRGPPSDLEGPELDEWIRNEVLKTEQGKKKLVGGSLDVTKAKKVIVVRRGKIINFVL